MQKPLLSSFYFAFKDKLLVNCDLGFLSIMQIWILSALRVRHKNSRHIHHKPFLVLFIIRGSHTNKLQESLSLQHHLIILYNVQEVF